MSDNFSQFDDKKLIKGNQDLKN
ncbi:hypothetical protein qdsa001_29 [Staphylococcus phage qdsa001]|nr:hypothetical protein qdsa001_29 [Staphylococcus phage qdsa001]